VPRSSKDLAKRLPFRRFPRPDTFRHYYFWTAIAAVGAAIVLWLLMGRVLGRRQYMPQPTTSVHATFSDRCESCHDSFQVVQDSRCLTCHAVRVHSEHEDHTPPCRTCHVEHREGAHLTGVSSALCVDCHGALASRRAEGPQVAVHIRTFAEHPEFEPLRRDERQETGDGRREQPRDPTRLRFNHAVHLTSKEITEPLECANCHETNGDGRYMTTAAFARYASRPGEDTRQWPPVEVESPGPRLIYCSKCHAQKVKEVPAPFSDVEVLHAKPEAIHNALIDDVLALGVRRAQTVFEADQVRLPGRVPRMAVDSESTNWSEFQDRWVGAIEAELYRPLRAAPSGGTLFENNRYCALCHEMAEAGQGAAVVIAPPAIPTRWLKRAEFSHRVHEKTACAECHGDLTRSTDTADVNLPRRELCQQCHSADAGRSAGTQCVLCHIYHETSGNEAKPRGRSRTLPIGVFLGKDGPKPE